MVICFVIPSLSGGGAERQLKYLSKYLVKKGVALHVIYRSTGPDESKVFIDGVKYHKLKPRGNYNLLALLELAEKIKSINPDIVQSWIIQSDIFIGILKLFYRFYWIVREANVGSNHKGFIKKYLRTYLLRFTDKIVANSPLGYKHWNSFGNVQLILNGVFEDVSSHDISNDVPQLTIPNKFILYVGRLNKHKNVDLLIQAFAKSGLWDRYKLLICGAGPESEMLNHLVTLNDLENSVDFLGFRGAKDIEFLMKNCDLVCLLSDYEGMPNVVIEAMRLNANVLLSPSNSHESLFSDEVVFYSPTIDVEDITKSLVNATNSSEKEMKIEKGQVFAKNFTVDNMGNSYLELYSTLLKETAIV